MVECRREQGKKKKKQLKGHSDGRNALRTKMEKQHNTRQVRENGEKVIYPERRVNIARKWCNVKGISTNKNNYINVLVFYASKQSF